MEEKGIKTLVGAIILAVVAFICVAAYLIYVKFFYKAPTPPVEEEKTNISYLICNKWSNIEYKKYEEFRLKYTNDQIYELELIYQYEYRYSYEKDKIRDDLRTLLNTEKKTVPADGFVGKYETTKEGGSLDMIYDLSDQNTRLYVNSKYYHNNIYLDKNKLSEYMVNNGYTCKIESDN